MVNVILFISGYALITFVVSLIFAKFNSKIYAFLENENYDDGIVRKYDGINVIFTSALWPLFPFFFILLGWHMLIEKFSK